jgi:hypothetical protein
LAPVKVDDFLAVPVQDLYFKLAFPRFVERPGPLASGRVRVSDQAVQPLALVEDLNAIAIQDLAARIGRVQAKAVARAALKYAAGLKIQEEARKSGNPLSELLAFLGTNVYTLATEEADKRSWRTLPGRIYLARLALEPGHYSLDLDLKMKDGSTRQLVKEVDLKAGQKLFVKETVF